MAFVSCRVHNSSAARYALLTVPRLLSGAARRGHSGPIEGFCHGGTTGARAIAFRFVPGGCLSFSSQVRTIVMQYSAFDVDSVV